MASIASFVHNDGYEPLGVSRCRPGSAADMDNGLWLAP